MTQPQQMAADPFELWRTWVGDSERQWNSFLNEAMSTDEFSQSMGRFMDVYLNMQKSMNEVMGRYLSAFNLPTRGDVLTLGDRLGAIEDTLTEIQTTLARAATLPPAVSTGAGAANANSVAAPKRATPARTKKPVKA